MTHHWLVASLVIFTVSQNCLTLAAPKTNPSTTLVGITTDLGSDYSAVRRAHHKWGTFAVSTLHSQGSPRYKSQVLCDGPPADCDSEPSATVLLPLLAGEKDNLDFRLGRATAFFSAVGSTLLQFIPKISRLKPQRRDV